MVIMSIAINLVKYSTIVFVRTNVITVLDTVFPSLLTDVSIGRMPVISLR